MVEPSRVHQSIRFHKRPTTSALFRTCRFLRVVKLLGVPPLHDMHSWPVMISDGCTTAVRYCWYRISIRPGSLSLRSSLDRVRTAQMAMGCQGMPGNHLPGKLPFTWIHWHQWEVGRSSKIPLNKNIFHQKSYYATQGVHKQIRPRTRTHCSVRECLLRILVFHVCLNCVQDASFMIIHTARCILGDLSIPVPCHSSGIVVLRSVAFASEASLAPINLFSIGWDKRQTAPKTAAPLPSRYLTVNLRRSTKSTRF